MSTLKVNRIEPRTGDTVDIVGFASGGRIVKTGMLFKTEQVGIAPNTTVNNLLEWTIPKTAPENNVAVFIEIGSIYTRTKSTSASSGVVTLRGYISADGGANSITGEKMTGCCPASSIGNPRDNWIIGNMAFTFTDKTNSPELNISLTGVSFGDSSSDLIYLNYNGVVTTLTWLEFEGV